MTLAETIWTELTGTEFRLTTVVAGGVPTRSLQAGAGEPVIFLHGTSGHLEAFTRNLGAHSERYACHAIDMLGHGYTGKPDYPLMLSRMVPRGNLHVMDHVSHHLQEERPAAYHAVVDGFLRSVEHP